MHGLRNKKYLQATRKRFDPLALILSFAGLIGVLIAAGSKEARAYLFDLDALLIVVGGTAASLLFQFDFSSTIQTFVVVLRSLAGTPEKVILATARQLDDAILNDVSLSDLREGQEISGELLNDVVFMHHRGLLFDEIDEFVTSRIADEYLGRQVAVAMLTRASMIAPAFGLFGTVMGLIGVLKSLSNPAQIGPSMSLALMTTAYGAGIGSLIFTPLAGRLEHHNVIYLESHKQIMSKIGILLSREERRMDRTHSPEVAAA